MPKPISMHPDDTRRVKVDWTAWLRGATIDSAEWDPDDPVTVANTSVDGNETVGFLTAASGSLDAEYKVDVSVTTTETPARTKKITLMVRMVETIL